MEELQSYPDNNQENNSELSPSESEQEYPQNITKNINLWKLHWAKIFISVNFLAIMGILIYMFYVVNEPRFITILSIVLFHSLIGGIVNIFIIFLLFHHIKFIPGSGAVERSAKSIKKSLAMMALTTIIPYEVQHNFFFDSISSYIEEVDFEDNFNKFFNSEEFHGIVKKTIVAFSKSMEGFILNFPSIDKNAIEQNIITLCYKYTLKSVPKMLSLITSEPFYSADKFHLEVATLVSKSLDEINPKELSKIIYSSVQEQFNTIVFWGNISGVFCGLFVAFVVKSRNLYEL